MKARFRKHDGEVNSAHCEAEEKYNLFIKPKASIREAISSQTTQYKAEYLARLKWSLECIKFILHQGLAFRGHDEGKDSKNKGNFRELLQWMAGNFEEVNKVVLGNAPQNCQMIDHKIQKQLISSCAHETTKFFIEELGDECFAILADESSDAYQQEQLALCLRFVNKIGEPVERFLGLAQVEDTTSLTLKEAIQTLLMKYQLPISKVRGQGYDGASNMKGHVNGLKKLIMEDSPSAYYVHCFAHQLQLTLVAVAKENIDCKWFFGHLAYLLNVLRMSCKKIRMLRVAQAEYMIEALKLGEIEAGQGLNQEMGLARPGDTRWGSHYKTVMHVMSLYPSIRKVLFRLGKESNSAEALGAQTMLEVFKSFEFVFMLHLMNEIFGYTSDLSNALQKRDQDIVNAVDLLEFTKVQLQVLREDDGWKEFLKNVTSFCVKHNVRCVDMDGKYKPIQRARAFYKNAMNYHRFHADMFLGVIDRQLQELNNRFDEVNTELLRCMASFSPAKSFSSFNIDDLVKLAGFYPHDFDFEEMHQLPFQLNLYITDVRNDENFTNLRSLAELSMILVRTGRALRYDIVYKLLKLVLVLPVATAGVERVFSSMNYIKKQAKKQDGAKILKWLLGHIH
ncbi:zinc finger MYM-type protein 1 isoform X1 [Triticum aestivum]|uniref:zinc finger MYM-type protein 1 isoform X1 n=1 Tax=Triticum aestivum TaxID=4565 RepID=UPI001D026E74|nr:zinc finger MYM-type protein 1-like isoform X1 [Triticum aestivum]